MMLGLSCLRNRLLGRGTVAGYHLQFFKELHVSKAASAGSVSSSNDILFNATASMRKNKDSARFDGEKVQVGSTGPYKKRTPKNGTSGHHIRKRTTVKWTTGTERAQSAANHTLQRIFKLNERGAIKVIDQDTNKLEETTILTWANGLDLQKYGIMVVDVEQRGSYSVPLVKLVESKVALKKYSDELAKRKEEELTKLGFSLKRSGRKNDNDHGDDNLKQIKVSWQISDADLNKQKSNEIITQLKKGCKVYLYLNGKDALTKTNWADDIGEQENDNKFVKKVTSKELSRRKLVVERIHEIVDEYAVTPIVEGDIASRLIMKVTPKPSAKKREDKTALKEQKKRERQAKLERNLEKKRLRDLEDKV